MHLPTRLAMSGLVVVGLVSLISCSSGSATPTPTAAPTTAASAALPSFVLPSGLPSDITLPSGGGQGGAPDAGSIVTSDMAASVIGGSPTKVAMPSLGGGVASIVAYTTSAGDTVTVLVEKVPGGIPAAALQAAMQMQGTQGQLQAVSGIGDAAGKVLTDHDATLAFSKNDVIVVLNAKSGSMAGTDLEPKLEALAQQVAGRL